MRNWLITCERRPATDDDKLQLGVPVRERWTILDLGLGPFGFEFIWKGKQ